MPSMKFILPLLALLGVAFLCGYSVNDFIDGLSAQKADVKAKKPKELPLHAAAKVGKEIIYATEVLGRVQEVESGRPAKDQLVGPAYEYVINTRLLRLEAKRFNIKASEADIQKEVDDYIERRKADLKIKYGGQMPWKAFLRENNLTEASMRESITKVADLMVMRRRLVNYWEQTTDSASIIEIVFKDPDPLAAKKKADDALAHIDSEVAAGVSIKDAFHRHAILASEAGSTPVREVYIDEPEPAVVTKAIFEDLKVNTYSTVLKVSDHEYRLVYLDAMRRREKKPFADLKKHIDTLGPVDKDDRYRRWINTVYRSARYPVQFRFPGRATVSTNVKPDVNAKPAEENKEKE